MLLRSIGALAMGFAFGASAFAQDITAGSGISTAVPPALNKGVPEKKICRSDMQTGSHMPGPRICMTKAQWDEQARTAQGYASGAQNYGQQPPTEGPR